MSTFSKPKQMKIVKYNLPKITKKILGYIKKNI